MSFLFHWTLWGDIDKWGSIQLPFCLTAWLPPPFVCLCGLTLQFLRLQRSSGSMRSDFWWYLGHCNLISSMFINRVLGWFTSVANLIYFYIDSYHSLGSFLGAVIFSDLNSQFKEKMSGGASRPQCTEFKRFQRLLDTNVRYHLPYYNT